MIDRSAAEQSATAFLANFPVSGRVVPLIIRRDLTIERPFGWVFFYDSKRHVETGDFRDALLGNAPLIVDRRDGSVHITGTANTVDYYIAEYEKNQGK